MDSKGAVMVTDAAATADQPRLDKDRHIKYWKRCLKSLLPHHYTGNESNRMYLAFFIISALDLLGAWHDVTNERDRTEYINWIYHCQHPNGGFRMWPGTDFGSLANDENARWDPANLPATYFALASLLIVGDDMKRIKRAETLEWIRHMQRKDGSFGETLVAGTIEGGKDPRFAYCAAGVRYILRGEQKFELSRESEVPDIDIESLVECIVRAESYDGGIADEAFHEPHAGYTFCSLGCLSFIGRLRTDADSRKQTKTAPSDPLLTLSWLVARQTDLSDPDAEAPAVNDKMCSGSDGVEDQQPTPPLHQSPDKSTLWSPFGVGPLEAGMNGRTNKVADTCYAWWGAACFHMLEQSKTYDRALLHRYLLDKTAHPVGGFGKYPGDVPDLYHSYLGLAALGLADTDGLKAVDAAMCISKEASARIHGLWSTAA